MASIDRLRAKTRRFFLALVYDHTVLLLAVLLCAGIAGVMWQLSRLSSQLIYAAAFQGTSLYASAISEFRSLYTSEVVARLRAHGIDVTHDYQTNAHAIPLPATLTIEFGKRLSHADTGVQVRLYSGHPFPWRKDGGPHDDFERAALRFLQDHPEQPFTRLEDDRDGRPSLRYAAADRMRPQCVGCHNTHPQSPKKDWRVGDVRGVLEVVRPLDTVVAQSQAGLRETFVFMLGLTGVGVVGLVVVIRKLRHVSVELEQKVDTRTAELSQAKTSLEAQYRELQKTEQQLAHHAEELARSNAELEQFAYVASHDLQEPLRMVASFTQLLGKRYKGRLDADADEFIGYAVDGATRMQQLINDLLAYSRVGTRGKEFAPTSGEVVLDRALQNLTLAIEDSGAVVTHDPLPTVLGDEGQLVQLFQNLIGNAVKFRGTEAPHVHVSAEVRAGEAVFSVRDNGIGIDPQFADRIFLIFERLHQQEQYPGTGIGLAICKKIVQRHGGRIEVESQPGRGTTFRFTMRAA